MQESTATVAAGIRVLVYGSLREGLGNHRYLEGCEHLGDYTIPASEGFKLISLGYFPGLVEAGEGEAHDIVTECYRIDLDTLDSLDMLEGNGSFYTRRKVSTPWKKAWVYVLPAEEYSGHDLVESGDWVEYITAGYAAVDC